MRDWQKIIKKIIDIIAAVSGLILLSPLLLFCIIKVKLSSPGPILYLQERTGHRGKTFIIFKFRSMFHHSEPNGPALSSDNDPRITPWGRTMRKWRLDELPQLWNIMLGQMSLVGPRPERRFYIDQIIRQSHDFNFLLQVKPGLTSRGMVEFGYAENVKEMITRMQYDIEYIKNISLTLDIKIMFQTLRIILGGKGK